MIIFIEREMENSPEGKSFQGQMNFLKIFHQLIKIMPYFVLCYMQAVGFLCSRLFSLKVTCF